MRHFGSLLIAAVFAPSIFLLTGTGLSAFNSALDDNKVFDPMGSLAALGALLLAGVLYGILVMARLSPLGPGLAGLASWGITGWALLDIESYREFFAGLDVHMGGAVGESGLGIMLGVPLLATIFSGRRWRRGGSSEVYAPQAEPEIPPPSLHYPVAAAFQSSSVESSVGSSWRASPYAATDSAALGGGTASAGAASAGTDSAASEEPGPPTFASAVLGLGASAVPEVAPRPVSETPAPSSEAPLADLPAMETMAERLMSWSASSAPDAEPPPPIVMAAPDEAAPLPRRVPAPPPGGREPTAPIISPPPPPDNEVTERLGPPGSMVPQAQASTSKNGDETVQLRQES